MRTLQLIDGDIVIGQQGYAEITGPQKVQQDLEVATLSPYGCNFYHPGWGSVMSNYIGQPQNSQTQVLIQSEITRLVNNYIAVQQDYQLAATGSGNPSPYTNEELVSGVGSINVVQNTTTAMTSVVVNTVAGNSLNIAVVNSV